METGATNTYQLSCRVVEVIYKEDKRIIKVVCNPGSIILETPDAGKAQLGDRLHLTGSFQIDTIRAENSSENH
jgi:hypothetical protein